ncbi:MAG: hypothetical protein E6X17_09270 [Sporomusaceae bacterium]|nr:hypothetical protein [Sporomusaceae bacterium]
MKNFTNPLQQQPETGNTTDGRPQDVSEGFLRQLPNQELLNARGAKTILIVHRALLLQEALAVALKSGGYANILTLPGIAAAWNLLTTACPPLSPSALIIGSLSETPQADEQFLIRRIKSNRQLQPLPVIYLTDFPATAACLGADALVGLFAVGELLRRLDELTALPRSIHSKNAGDC